MEEISDRCVPQRHAYAEVCQDEHINVLPYNDCEKLICLRVSDSKQIDKISNTYTEADARLVNATEGNLHGASVTAFGSSQLPYEGEVQTLTNDTERDTIRDDFSEITEKFGPADVEESSNGWENREIEIADRIVDPIADIKKFDYLDGANDEESSNGWDNGEVEITDVATHGHTLKIREGLEANSEQSEIPSTGMQTEPHCMPEGGRLALIIIEIIEDLIVKFFASIEKSEHLGRADVKKSSNICDNGEVEITDVATNGYTLKIHEGLEDTSEKNEIATEGSQTEPHRMPEGGRHLPTMIEQIEGSQQFLTQNRDDHDYTTHIANLKEYSDVFAVFPAYRCGDATKCQITIAVVRNTPVNSELINELELFKLQTNTDYVIKYISDFPQYEIEVEVGNTGINDTDKEMMHACLKKNAYSLMLKHKNLSIVQGRFYKTNINPQNDAQANEPRLVFYVLVKGYIPIGEDPFDKLYDGIQVDVREGMFTMFGNHADEALSNIRMGCRIERVVDGQSFTGTLGAFFEHPEHGLCAITCAHAILTPEEHLNCIKYGLNKTWIDHSQQMVVFQPASPHVLGHVVGIICSEGTMSNTGNDIAIIRIVDNRKPLDGKWPQPRHAEHVPEFEYSSGRVFKSKHYAGNCYKFGGKSEYTKGVVVNFGMNVAREIQMHGTSVQFNNLIEVKQFNNKFAYNGDSGASVFVKDGDGDYVCIGILVGGILNVGPYYVIPIENILNDIGITKLKSFSPSNAELARSIGLMDERIGRMDEKIEQLIGRMEEKIDLLLGRSNS